MSTNEWLRIRLDIFRDPAVIRLAELMMTDRATTVGMLVHFWSWCNEQSDTGHVNVTAEFVNTHVASVAKRPKRKAKTFVNSMVFVGWLALEVIDDVEVVAVPEFQRYMSESSKKRALERVRKVSVRKNTEERPQKIGQKPDNSRKNSGQNADQEQEVRNENVEANNNTAVAAASLNPQTAFVCYAVEAGIGRKVAEGLERDGATRADLDRAIANANKVQPTNRPGYLVSCIRDNYDAIETEATVGTYDLCCGETTEKRSSPGGNRSVCKKCAQWYEGSKGKPIPKAKTVDWRVPT